MDRLPHMNRDEIIEPWLEKYVFKDNGKDETSEQEKKSETILSLFENSIDRLKRLFLSELRSKFYDLSVFDPKKENQPFNNIN